MKYTCFLIIDFDIKIFVFKEDIWRGKTEEQRPDNLLEEFGLSDPSVSFLNILSFQEEDICHKADDGESDKKKRANWDENEKEIIDFREDISKPDFGAEEGKEEDHGFQEHARDFWKLAASEKILETI